MVLSLPLDARVHMLLYTNTTSKIMHIALSFKFLGFLDLIVLYKNLIV
jgi:hypothetical protein